MKKIILFLALVLSLFIGYGQPRQTSTARQAPSSTSVRTPSASRTQSTYSATKPSTPRPSAQPVQKQPVQTARPVTRPVTTTVRKETQQPKGERRVVDGPRTPNGHGEPGHNPHTPNGGHGNVPPGYNPPPRPPHPYNPHYYHPYHHRDIYLHRVYWNPFVPVIYLDGFWFYTHNYYYVDYGVRTTYVYTYNDIYTVKIIDYVVDEVYTYCIQKNGCERYFRVYDNSNRLVAQQKIHWRYNELIYDQVTGGVWCKGSNNHYNLFFIMDNGQLVCYSE